MSTGPFGSGSFGTGTFQNSPFFTTKGLIDAILRATGHSTPSVESAKRIVVLDAINNRYSLITTSQDWDWLYQEVDFLLEGPYSDGSINLESKSQEVVGVGTQFNSNIIPNNVLYIPTRNETYLISTVESPLDLTLEGQYAGDDITDLAYQIIKPIYRLPSDLEQLQSVQVDSVGELIAMGRQEFVRLKQSYPGLSGMPKIFTEVGRRAEDGVRLMEVYPSPDKNYTARLHYGVNIMRLSDSDDSYPLVPDRHRAVLFYGGLSDMYAYLRDFSMSSKYEDTYALSLLNMRNDTKITDSKIQFAQARNYRNRSNRRSRRGLRRSYTASEFASEE